MLCWHEVWRGRHAPPGPVKACHNPGRCFSTAGDTCRIHNGDVIGFGDETEATAEVGCSSVYGWEGLTKQATAWLQWTWLEFMLARRTLRRREPAHQRSLFTAQVHPAPDDSQTVERYIQAEAAGQAEKLRVSCRAML